MERNDYGKAYSCDSYATKHEVAKDLPFRQGIEVFWQKILEYRALYQEKTSLRNVDRTPLNITMTHGIISKISSLERRLNKLLLNYEKLAINDYARIEFRRHQLTCILKNIALIYGIDVDDNVLDAIINDNQTSLAPNQIVVKNYFQCLKEIESGGYLGFDLDCLLKFAKSMSGINNEYDLYRHENIQDHSLNIYDSAYLTSPVERISPMLENLFEFLSDESYSPLIKSILSYFYLSVVQPFNYYDEEIAILFAKAILYNSDYLSVSTLINIESLISTFKDEMSVMFKETLTSNDLTYVLYRAINITDEELSSMSSQLNISKANEIHNEFFNVQMPSEVKENKEIIEKRSEIVHNVDYEVKVALPKLPLGLDERDASNIAEHLLELNPNLKRAEALFYAHHCTVGKYYTIQQFKAMIDCAYETARTSMDNLAKLGYYRKEMIKNKFVYTPVQRK